MGLSTPLLIYKKDSQTGLHCSSGIFKALTYRVAHELPRSLSVGFSSVLSIQSTTSLSADQVNFLILFNHIRACSLDVIKPLIPDSQAFSTYNELIHYLFTRLIILPLVKAQTTPFLPQEFDVAALNLPRGPHRKASLVNYPTYLDYCSVTATIQEVHINNHHPVKARALQRPCAQRFDDLLSHPLPPIPLNQEWSLFRKPNTRWLPALGRRNKQTS